VTYCEAKQQDHVLRREALHMTYSKKDDAYGQEIDAVARGLDVAEIIERDDGYIDAMFGHYLVAPFSRWDVNERKAIKLARGRVLDVGAGGGRVSLYLQERGLDVLAIDISPLAIEVCKRRGVKKARVLDFAKITPRLGTFDTIVMYGNNFGLFGSPARAKRLLKVLHRMTSDDARIIAETLDPYATKVPEHLAYHRRNRKRGRSGGQVRIRVRSKLLKSPWFDYLFASRSEMRDIAKGTGWKVVRTIPERGEQYIGILEKV
jgi:SAM-dependent methyltransferase